MTPHWGRRGGPRYPGMGPKSPSARGMMRRPGPPSGMAGPLRLPDPKAIFARLDKDNDKKLSLEEFAAGIRSLHRVPGRPPFMRPPMTKPEIKRPVMRKPEIRKPEIKRPPRGPRPEPKRPVERKPRPRD